MIISVLKRLIHTTVWTIISLYIIIVILLHIPTIQGHIGSWTADALSKKIGTKVSIGRIDLGFINRLIIDDICILDQKNKNLLKASRASIKINFIPLLEKRISISSIQIFGMDANLYKESNMSKTNFQFVLDSLSNKNKNNSSSIDLQINSIVIRHGSIKYRCMSEKIKTNTFSLNNINLKHISGHIILDKLSNDSLDVKVKRLSFEEHSGLILKKLSFKLSASKNNFKLDNLNVEMPASKLHVDSIDAAYILEKNRLNFSSLTFRGSLSDSYLTPSDIAFCQPLLKDIKNKIYFNANLYGHDGNIYVTRLRIHEKENLFNLKSDLHFKKNASGFNWSINKFALETNGKNIKTLLNNIPEVKIPETIFRLGNIEITGMSHSVNDDMTVSGVIQTDLGATDIDITKRRKTTSGIINARNIDVKTLTDNGKFGFVNAQIEFNTSSSSKINLSGNISSFDYNRYTYHKLMVDGTYDNGNIEGKLALNDPNAQINLAGNVNVKNSIKIQNLNANIKDFSPSALNLSDKWPQTKFSMKLTADIEGNDISDIIGQLRISNFSMVSPQTEYKIDSLYINAEGIGNKRRVIANSDFCNIDMFGNINYITIPQSIIGLIHSKLPTMPWYTGIKAQRNNDFTINATIKNSKWMSALLGIPIELYEPVTLNGELSDKNNALRIDCQMPSFAYNSVKYKDATLRVSTIGDIMNTYAGIKKISDKGKLFSYRVKATAGGNELDTEISINENENHPLKGTINANTFFYKNAEGHATANINIKESNINIDDTIWHVKPSNIIYNKNYLEINNFSVEHSKQHVSVTGKATKNQSDSIRIDFNDININYILDMVNFHSVEFDGFATGKAYLKDLSGKNPYLFADLTVNNFLFEKGRMGTLKAKAMFNNTEKQIDINAVATDGQKRKTSILGYVSPQKNYIDLNINAHNTRLEFMESFCSSFMHDVDARANGSVRLSGSLDNINLTGMLVADGTLGITPLNTNYTLRNDTIRFIPDEIEFRNDSIFDKDGNTGIVEGNIHHKHLTNLSYDLSVVSDNLLAFNTDGENGDSFYGTVYATGDCKIKGRSGEVVMDINVVPEDKSIIVYDVSSQNDVSTNEFIQWKTPVEEKKELETSVHSADIDSISDGRQTSSDIRLNFLLDCNPSMTIKVLMDRQSGDYISLNGNGALRATYYNKGSFDLFGNYTVERGIYKLTIRDIIKKEFTFQRGGTIKFVGNPFNSSLDLKAIYVLNGVSLSDLNIGNSFSNNNVRVNCLMNVTGTPDAPRVSFDLDMPTLSNDAKQMVASVINAEEEMNQQVLYLLTVGRFYTQNSNNNSSAGGPTSRNQASLAMQSILSGTISQQLNNILGNIINSSDWNFGANISTGTEGFNDAEYVGILSGRLLNNRLLINGQFGYRDNANATTSFIGDFDLRYLLFPNGNLSINVYNKTNDRYFTKNSLNTQGIGLIMKKDFNGIGDLFRKKKKNKK